MAALAGLSAGELPPSQIFETREALEKGETCVAIVEQSLARIAEQGGSDGINAVTLVPREQALAEAAAIDQRLGDGEEMRPLECVTLGVKDNIDVAGQPTTAGSIALAGNIAPADAPVVARLRSDGAIVVARTNMAEWAFSPRHTISSIAGETVNPYDPALVPAGSSGGSAAGEAAGLFAISLGTDTGNSIRGPSAHNALVGLRSSIGLVPIDGIVPLLAQVDVVGPMVTSVRDAAIMLDTLTASPGTYTDDLGSSDLAGITVAVVPSSLTGTPTHPEIAKLFERAQQDLKSAGANIVELDVAAIRSVLEDLSPCFSFRADVRKYFQSRGGIFANYDPLFAYQSGLYSKEFEAPFKFFLDSESIAECPAYQQDKARQTARSAIEAMMTRLGADFIAYPTWSSPPASRKRWNEDYAGDNSQVLVPPTGLPAITVPMGFLGSGAPGGIQFVGRFEQEKALLDVAFAYEQLTLHRESPELTP
ncbi:amidase [Erythrobacter sp. AP23]|uniref:amidase n=1 Tax=Erythrobacter sp. AP23 TaxID=499656 RepID=UPI00076DE265|nr:amidase [Erythrobacter sp. AP23]KWV92529.1 hypothetical protein ASS64_14870 [Erythrobacter sp. AP23]